jgi:hypothetical protein
VLDKGEPVLAILSQVGAISLNNNTISLTYLPTARACAKLHIELRLAAQSSIGNESLVRWSWQPLSKWLSPDQ